MKLERVDGDEWNKVVNDSGGTLLRVPESTEMDGQSVKDLYQFTRSTDSSSGGKRESLLNVGATQGDTLLHAEIDLEALWTLMYEHRRYTEAKGFSDAEMDVLRAIEFHPAERVGVDEIMSAEWTEDVSESMVYKSLKRLQEKDLVTKIRPGVYQYTGP